MSGSEQASGRAGSNEVWLRRRSTVLAIAIALVTILAYLPALKAGYVWDDDWYVTRNPHLQDIPGLARLWLPKSRPQYYPVVFTTFWIEYQLWGLRPLGYHLDNVVLHALNALLVWRVSSALRLPGAWWIGAVFALHPVHVESVAWITERKNVLSALFYLLAALAYLRFDPLDDGSPQVIEPAARASGPGRWRWYGLASTCFVLALLSKTVTCSLPAVLILAMSWRRVPITWRRLAPLAPMFAVGLALALHTAHLERTEVGAAGAEFDFSVIERAWIACRALLFYPHKLLIPWPLVFIYPRWNLPEGDLLAYWPVAAVASIVAGAVVAFRHGWRGPSLALAFFAGTLFPALGFFSVYPMRYSFVADHFQYLASLGIIALVVSGFALHVHRSFATGLGAFVLATFFFLTWNQCYRYAGEETLWRATVRDNPRAWMAHSNLAKLLSERGDNEESLAHLNQALAVDPDEKAADQIRLNVAVTLGKLRRHSEALERYRELQRTIGGMEIKLAQTLERLGRDEEAESYYRQALRGSHRDDARVPFALHMLRRGDPAAAIESLEPFIAAHGADLDGLMFLADAYAAAGRLDDARTTAQRALGEARARRDARTAELIEKRLSEWRGGE